MDLVNELQLVADFDLAAWLLFDHLARVGATGSILLLVYWALNLPVLGREIVGLIRQYPHVRSITLLLHGLDRRTLGPRAWRRRVVSASQFHQNHVLTASFSFNLLMGRSWPAHPEDLREAEALCRSLGLGDLLDRMPSGLAQMVDETGWQLSHGEHSRHLSPTRKISQRFSVN